MELLFNISKPPKTKIIKRAFLLLQTTNSYVLLLQNYIENIF